MDTEEKNINRPTTGNTGSDVGNKENKKNYPKKNRHHNHHNKAADANTKPENAQIAADTNDKTNNRPVNQNQNVKQRPDFNADENRQNRQNQNGQSGNNQNNQNKNRHGKKHHGPRQFQKDNVMAEADEALEEIRNTRANKPQNAAPKAEPIVKEIPNREYSSAEFNYSEKPKSAFRDYGKELDNMPLDPKLDVIFGKAEEKPQTIENGVEVVGVHFPQGGKVYWFDPTGIAFSEGNRVIVETARGTEMGEIAVGNRLVSAESIVPPLRPIIRLATEADMAHEAENAARCDGALKICAAKVEKHNLGMKLVGAQYTFDNAKLIFYFTAASRVDFRELVKDLASEFRTRIELRQIGIRDEAKMLGGRGICGRKLCCSSFLPNYAQVSVKMAKEQGLSLNSSKISGNCGRLMCCLKYEQDTYDRELELLPAPDSIVDTPDGRGIVTEVKPISQAIKVKINDKPDQAPRQYSMSDIKIIKKVDYKRDDSPDSEDEIN